MVSSLLLWDFDGTLADSLASSLRIFNALAAKHGFRPVEDPEALRSLSLRAILRRHGISMLKLPSLVREFIAAQKEEIAAVRLVSGLPAVLRELHQRDVPQSILSSNSADNITACLRANEVDNLFASVVGYRRLFGKGKALRRFRRNPVAAGRDVLYVGDEVRDIEAARQAGVRVAAVTWGMNAKAFLASREPDYLIERPEELLQVV